MNETVRTERGWRPVLAWMRRWCGSRGQHASRGARDCIKALPVPWSRMKQFLSVTVFAVLTSCTTPSDTSVKGTTGSTSNASEPSPARPASARPTIPPPTFRIYRFKFNELISLVVPTNTSDEQLKSLLWLFREKVRSHNFRDIGITQPVSNHFGKHGYTSGMLEVYRGEMCANELFSDGTDNCGDGEHDAAYYQWGVFGDDPKNGIDPNKDEAGIRLASGEMVKLFDYKDGWQPIAAQEQRTQRKQ